MAAFPGDDGLDTDQGYLGTVQFFVQLQNNAIDANGATTARATVNVGDSMSENDGPENFNSAVPYSVYTLANATFVGRGYNAIAERFIGGSGNAATSLIEPATGPNYRDNASAQVYNSLFMDAPHGAMLIMDRRSVSDTGNLGSGGNSAINRFYTNRASGGFDGAGRAADLTTANSGAAATPDGLFHNVWFFRCGLLDTGAAGGNGKYQDLATLNAAVNSDPSWYVASSTNLFPDRTDRSERGSNGNGNAFRANIPALQAVITNSTGVKFDQDPGVVVPISHRTSGMDLKVTAAAARNLTNSAIPTDRATSGHRKMNDGATFVGAVRDSSWFAGWNFASQSGAFDLSRVRAIAPTVSLSVNGSSQAVVSFDGEVGVKYTIEVSADNKAYTPVHTLEAVAGANSWTDTSGTVGATPRLYRVIAL